MKDCNLPLPIINGVKQITQFVAMLITKQLTVKDVFFERESGFCFKLLNG